MAELTSLARPYAKAAFEYAKEIGSVDDWSNFLQMATSVVQNPGFVDVLNNPAISYETKVRLLTQVLVGDAKTAAEPTPMQQVLNSVRLAGVDVDSLMPQGVQSDVPMPGSFYNFIMQLAENDRLLLLPAIDEQFNKFKASELKQLDVYVTSAYPLSDSERTLLQQTLAKSENAVVILHEKVDATLLGGATIKIGDKFTDGSVRGKLTQLKTQLLA